MKRRLLSAAAALTLAIGGSSLTAGPAHASDMPGALCMLTSNAWLHAGFDFYDGGYWVLRTLHAGRGFRAHGGGNDAQNRDWLYGHGAEAPTQDGWILRSHTNC